MNLCSDHHDEVCFEGQYCPLCVMRDEKDDEIKDLKSEIDNLKDEIKDLSQ